MSQNNPTVGLNAAFQVRSSLRTYRKFFDPDYGVTTPPRYFTVTDRERGFVWVLESWEPWRKFHYIASRFGEDEAMKVIGFRVAERGARDAFFRPITDTDFREARGMAREAGIAATPFDTITPEDVINGAA